MNEPTLLSNPGGDEAPPVPQLDALLAATASDLKAVEQNTLCCIDQAMHEIEGVLNDVVVGKIAEMDAHIADADFTISDAMSRTDNALNATLYESWLAAYHAGADVPIEGFPEDALVAPPPKPSRKRVLETADQQGDLPELPVAQALPGVSPPPANPFLPPTHTGSVGGGNGSAPIPEIKPPKAIAQAAAVYQAPPIDASGETHSQAYLIGERGTGLQPGPGNKCTEIFPGTQLCEWSDPATGFYESAFVNLQPDSPAATTPIGTSPPPATSLIADGLGDVVIGPLVPCPAVDITPVCPPEIGDPVNSQSSKPLVLEVALKPTMEPIKPKAPTYDGGLCAADGPALFPNATAVATYCLEKDKRRDEIRYDADSWCTRLTRLKPIALRIGKRILAGNKYKADSTVLDKQSLYELLHPFHAQKDDSPIAEAIYYHWKGSYAEVTQGYLREWVEGMALIGIDSYGEAAELRACQAVLQGFLDSSVLMVRQHNRNYDHAEGTESSAGFDAQPSILGFGAGIGTTRKLSWKAEKGWSKQGITNLQIRPFLIACIEAIAYLINQAERPNTLTTEQALASYLAGAIDQSKLDCYLGMQGLPYAEGVALKWTASTRLGIGEAISAYRRGLINAVDMQQLMREQGCTQEFTRDILYRLSEQVPPAGDLIRFMVRDVADPKIVNRFRLDEEFTDKWAGPLPAWGKAIGVSDELALNYWRAHWRLPGLGQAYECLHRLRPGSKAPDGSDISTSVADVEVLVAQDDMLPFWRQRLIAISYHPLTRVDSVRMFQMGELDEVQLAGIFQDLGYTLDNANLLVGFMKQRRFDFLLNQRATKAYIAGGITILDWHGALDRYQVSADEYAALSTQVDLMVRARTNLACVRGIKSRYMVGEIDQAEALDALLARQLPHGQSLKNVEAWKCERASKSTQPTAVMLCKWFKFNLISAAQFRTRLVRLGYSNIDASRIVQACSADAMKGIKMVQEKDARKQAVEEAKAERKAAREQAVADAAGKRAERALNKEDAAAKRQGKRLLKAAETLALRTGQDVAQMATDLRDAIAGVMNDYALTQGEAEDIVLQAVAGWNTSMGLTFAETVDQYARAEEALDLLPAPLPSTSSAPS